MLTTMMPDSAAGSLALSREPVFANPAEHSDEVGLFEIDELSAT
jgi:hypothetical protein